ncbi:MAG: ADP-ribosylglycohydrolase family protein [Eubacteriales bacterium]
MIKNVYDYIDGELLQSREEGRDVSGLDELVRAIHTEENTEQKNELAKQFYSIIESRPIVSGFKYHEPSDYEGILAARPKNRPALEKAPADFDKIYGAWLGRCAGCLLGKPVEGVRRAEIYKRAADAGNYPIKRYLTDGVDCMPNDDDTNYTMTALYILEHSGFDFTTQNVADAWLTLIPAYATFTAERAAYRNILCGVPVSKTALTYNPYREWIGAQIRADGFGYVCPGDAERAASLAYKDAALSHIKNGIYGEMFVAAMLAAAAVTADLDTIIRAGLGEIPENCRLAEGVLDILERCRNTENYVEIIDFIHSRYNEASGHDWCHTISNALIVVCALYYGKFDLSATIGIAVEAAFDTDCNGATSGSIVGMVRGASALPDGYVKPLNDTMRTQMAGFDGSSITDLARRTAALVK